MKRLIKIHNLTLEEMQRLAEDIYVYGYPLVLMDTIKRTHTSTPFPTQHGAPLNHFAHVRLLPDAHSHHAVHSNADCLRSFAWLDLSRDCVVLSVPRIRRHYLLSFFSAWYEIFETSSPRTGGAQGMNLGFVSPRWRGKLPTGVKRIVAPTETVWIEGWFEADGPEDIELVHGVQDQLRLTPVSEWGVEAKSLSAPFRVDVDHKTTPQEQVEELDARTFYTRLSRLMRKSPAAEGDGEIVAEFARIGFFPCEDFAFEMLPPGTVQAMNQAVPAAQAKIAGAQAAIETQIRNDWSLRVHPGRYQKNYLDRAAAARSGLTTALAEDVLCFHTSVDDSGEPLKGANAYVIKFGSESMPPANAFWSITLYDARHHLVPNRIHRNAIGDRDRLKHNSDKSLAVQIQHDWPGIANDSNWLPAPRDAFSLVLRMYWPKPEAFNGSWRPPAVMRASEV